MSELTIENILVERFEKVNAESGDGALSTLKNQAIEKFNELQIPALKSEAYKYTQIQRILKKNFDFAIANEVPTWTKVECEQKFYDQADANHLVFINGEFVEDYSTILADSGIEVKALNESTFETEADIKTLLGKTRGIENDAFAALNLSFLNSGLFLNVPKNTDANDTFVYHFVDGTKQNISFPRILINGNQGSRANFYEKTFTKGEENHLTISIVEASVKPNAEVRFTKLQQLDTHGYAIEGIYADQDKDSRFYTNTYSFKGAVIRNNIHINIGGENSEGHMNGLYQLSGQTHVDNNTSVDHLVANCFSNELYKGILDENSRGVFNGKIYVRPDAQKTNAFQSNNNILLSEGATVNTKPQLEIWADDVKCSHGCTTGQLDEEAIFYLRARGIDKKSARALMLNAFANETLEEVKNGLVKEEIEGIILNKLHY